MFERHDVAWNEREYSGGHDSFANEPEFCFGLRGLESE